MRKIFLLISIFAMLATVSYAESIDTDKLYREANQLYSEGEFEESNLIYQKIVDRGLHSPELLYNLANSYYKINMPVKAIINYERALILKPGDEDILYNLSIANRFVVDDIEEVPAPIFNKIGNSIKNQFTMESWGYIALAAILLTIALIGSMLFSNSNMRKKISFYLSIVMVVIFITSLISGLSHRDKIVNRNSAIVTAGAVTIKGAPDKSSTDLFIIHEGAKLKIIDNSFKEWKEIKLQNGQIGWINISDIEII